MAFCHRYLLFCFVDWVFVTVSCVLLYGLRVPPTQERFTSVTVFFLRFLMLCVLDIRFAGLPLVTSSFSAFFYNLRA